MKAFWAGAAAVVVAACGGSSSGTTGSGTSSVTGTVGGQSIPTVNTTGLWEVQSSDGGVSLTIAGAFISSNTSECSNAQSHVAAPDLTGLIVAVASLGTTVPAGTYTIGKLSPAGQEAQVSFGATNGQCMSTASSAATGGTVTITNADSSSVAGSFDATFASGDHVTGNFSAPSCVINYMSGASAPTCG